MGDSDAGDSFIGLFMKSGEAPGDKLLEDLVLNFLIAGRDTTAQAMAWCLWNIAQHPAVEERILVEGQEICGAGPLGYDMINRLDYVEAVIRESPRLHPSVPLDAKEALADDTLPNGTWVSHGSTVAWSTFAMGRSTRIWGEDAAEFKPERWLNMEIAPDSYANPVFRAGPRECLGPINSIVPMYGRAVALAVCVQSAC